jgi:hypothetical protein
MLIDEASMIDCRMAHHLAETGAKIILSGDP